MVRSFGDHEVGRSPRVMAGTWHDPGAPLRSHLPNPLPPGWPSTAMNLSPYRRGLPAMNLSPYRRGLPAVNLSPYRRGLPAVNLSPYRRGLPAVNLSPYRRGLPAVNLSPYRRGLPAVNLSPYRRGLPAVNLSPYRRGLPAVNLSPYRRGLPAVNLSPYRRGLPAVNLSPYRRGLPGCEPVTLSSRAPGAPQPVISFKPRDHEPGTLSVWASRGRARATSPGALAGGGMMSLAPCQHAGSANLSPYWEGGVMSLSLCRRWDGCDFWGKRIMVGRITRGSRGIRAGSEMVLAQSVDITKVYCPAWTRRFVAVGRAEGPDGAGRGGGVLFRRGAPGDCASAGSWGVRDRRRVVVTTSGRSRAGLVGVGRVLRQWPQAGRGLHPGTGAMRGRVALGLDQAGYFVSRVSSPRPRQSRGWPLDGLR
jgi:hypothetical protein